MSPGIEAATDEDFIHFDGASKDGRSALHGLARKQHFRSFNVCSIRNSVNKKFGIVVRQSRGRRRRNIVSALSRGSGRLKRRCARWRRSSSWTTTGWASGAAGPCATPAASTSSRAGPCEDGDVLFAVEHIGHRGADARSQGQR